MANEKSFDAWADENWLDTRSCIYSTDIDAVYIPSIYLEKQGGIHHGKMKRVRVTIKETEHE
jgi:hypothetical protein